MNDRLCPHILCGLYGADEARRPRILPYLSVNVPFDRGPVERRHQSNFIAIELKRRASSKKAKETFGNLAVTKKVLKYPLTIFVNVDSNKTHFALCPRSITVPTFCFSVHLEQGEPVVRRKKCGLAARE